MFGRHKDQKQAGATSASAETAGEPLDQQRGAGKNRPTPTRREAEAARRQPLVPADRKAAQRASRDKERQARAKQREAMLRGETWALPPRDRGPQREYIRDHIDARWSVGEFIMPVVLIGFALSIVPNRTTLLIGYSIVYIGFLAAILDFVILWFFLKRRIVAGFGSKPERGSLFYALTRVLQVRPGRIPRPRVRRGQYPT